MQLQRGSIDNNRNIWYNKQVDKLIFKGDFMRIPAILSDSLIGAADLDYLFGGMQTGSSNVTGFLPIVIAIFAITIIIVAILISYIISKHMEGVAFEKGYDRSAHAFAMCFWLGPIGYIYVAMLPNKRKTEAILLLAETLKENQKEKTDKDQ